MVITPVSYKIETEVPSSYYGKLFEYVFSQYYKPQKKRFSNISKEITQTTNSVSYIVLNTQGKQILQIEITGSDALNVEITPLNNEVSEKEIEEAKQDVTIATKLFEEKARKATWYFAWQEGEKIVPEKVKLHEKSFNRLFLETQILLTFTFLVIGGALFITVIKYYPTWFWAVPIILITTQFVFIFYSNKIIARTGDWTITKDNPIIHFLEFHPPIGLLGTTDDYKQVPPEQLAAI